MRSTLLLSKYANIAEDILIDFLNHTIIRQGVNAQFEDLFTSIDRINNSTKSLIRWGDGESFILMRRNIYFQKYSPSLRRYLLKILKNYKNQSPYFLCFPHSYLTCHTRELFQTKKGEVSFYQMHKGTRYVFQRYCPKKAHYLSHFIFKGKQATHLERLLKLLDPFDRFVVAHSQPNTVTQFFRLYLPNKEYQVVSIPGKNAFDDFYEILKAIRAKVGNLSINEHIGVLIAAGPCAKALVYELSQDGVIAYDIGKFFECWIKTDRLTKSYQRSYAERDSSS